ncbi:hypothetical protein J2W51_000961 [Tardiphaga robiniae]|nr:hypothetical protein [Tardiphaga robiniae]MDR6658419.1 hypothetical protein [Tardiphaga robiniae]
MRDRASVAATGQKEKPYAIHFANLFLAFEPSPRTQDPLARGQ